MVTTTTTKVVVRRGRYNELKTMLENRRRQLLHEARPKFVMRGPTALSSETCSIRARAPRWISRTRSDSR